jgi:hypothetical protein
VAEVAEPVENPVELVLSRDAPMLPRHARRPAPALGRDPRERPAGQVAAEDCDVRLVHAYGIDELAEHDLRAVDVGG